MFWSAFPLTTQPGIHLNFLLILLAAVIVCAISRGC